MLNKDTCIKLNDDVEIPQIGFGVYEINDEDECRRAVLAAFEAGYRHVDTAVVYGNEDAVGQALTESGLVREDVFVTTKLIGRMLENPRGECEKSLERLQTSYVDLLLIHWPNDELMIDAWETMQVLKSEGKARSIGVSNFTQRRFDEAFLTHTDVIPSINQIELHPFWYRCDLIAYCEGKGIRVEGYSPLARAQRFDNATLVRIAGECGKSPAQVLIRWQLQHGWVVIPKSSHPERIRENIDVFDFELNAENMLALDGLNEDLATQSWRPQGYY